MPVLETIGSHGLLWRGDFMLVDTARFRNRDGFGVSGSRRLVADYHVFGP